MTNEEIIRNIKEQTKKYLFQAEVDSYIKGYLDALEDSHEISWLQRGVIEDDLC